MMFWGNSLPEIENPQSKTFPGSEYVDHTSNLRQRISGHNAGKCPHTSKSVLWNLDVHIAFQTLPHMQRVSIKRTVDIDIKKGFMCVLLLWHCSFSPHKTKKLGG
jgi:hypothetical protein